MVSMLDSRLKGLPGKCCVLGQDDKLLSDTVPFSTQAVQCGPLGSRDNVLTIKEVQADMTKSTRGLNSLLVLTHHLKQRLNMFFEDIFKMYFHKSFF